jgi:hypothetical protein
MKAEEIKTRKDFMIYMLQLLNEEGRQVDLGRAFFKSGYNRGIESFEGVMDELDELGWIKKRKTPTGSIPGMPYLVTNEVTYEITLRGTEYLASIGELVDKHPTMTKPIDRSIKITGNTVNYNEQSNFGDQSQSSSHKTKAPATPKKPLIKKILLGVVISVISGLIIWFITTS